MSYIVVIRTYKPGDEFNCLDMIKEGVMSSMNTAFLGNIMKEITFQMMILFAAVMFIFFGVPFTVCLLVVPMVILLTYVGTYFAFILKAMDIKQQIQSIPK